MRTFEAPGVGALQVIDRPDVDRYYIPGEEVLVYESIDELMRFVPAFSVTRSGARKIREAGQKRTLAEHTFDQRVKIWSSYGPKLSARH